MNNKHYFKLNSEIHNSNTRTKSDLHHPPSHLSVYQKGTYTGIMVFNSLPVPTKDLVAVQRGLEQIVTIYLSYDLNKVLLSS
jgi:hypothetical protein